MAQSFGERMRHLRVTLGRRGPKTSLRDFGAVIDMNYRTIMGWEGREDPPRSGRGDITLGLSRLDSVRERGLNPERIVDWLWTGAGDRPEPANLDDKHDPRKTSSATSVIELVHRTPHFGTSSVKPGNSGSHLAPTVRVSGPQQPAENSGITIVDPEVALERAIQDADSGLDPRPKIRAAISMIRAMRAAKAAGLGAVILAVSSSYGDMQNNAKIRRENLALWAAFRLLRKKPA